MGLVLWREMADYKSLSALNNAFKQSSDTFADIPFPNIDRKESLFILEVMQEKEFNKDKIKAVERHRVLMEIWINYVMQHILNVSSETRRMCKVLLFSSPENSSRFNGWMRANSIFEGDSGLDSIREHEEGGQNEREHSLFNIRPHKKDVTLTLSKENLTRVIKKKDYLRNNVAGSDTARSDTHSDSSKTKSKFGGLFRKKNKAKSVASDEPTIVREARDRDHTGHDAIAALSALKKTSVLMTTQVQRGEENASGVQVYNVYLRVSSKANTPVVYRTAQRYKNFKLLHNKLWEINDEIASGASSSARRHEESLSTAATGFSAPTAASKSAPYKDFMRVINAPFPALPIKSYFRMSLNDKELHNRTQMLDAWFREIAFYYRDMPSTAREAVRIFLNFDMRKAVDVFVHDQLAWGMMEAPKSDAPLLIVRHSTIIKLHDSVLDGSTKDASLLAYAAGGGDSTQSKSVRLNLKDVDSSMSERYSYRDSFQNSKRSTVNSTRSGSKSLKPSHK
eukprot:gene26936-30454_t